MYSGVNGGPCANEDGEEAGDNDVPGASVRALGHPADQCYAIIGRG